MMHGKSNASAWRLVLMQLTRQARLGKEWGRGHQGELGRYLWICGPSQAHAYSAAAHNGMGLRLCIMRHVIAYMLYFLSHKQGGAVRGPAEEQGVVSCHPDAAALLPLD